MSGGYCTRCNQHVRVDRQGVNHILHLLLSVFTAGIWLIVWIILGLKGSPWYCTRCGAVVKYSIGAR